METKLVVRCFVDRKVALLRGHVLGETVDIAVTPAELGERWPALVAALDMSRAVPLLNGYRKSCGTLFVAGPAVGDLLEAMQLREAVAAAAELEETREQARLSAMLDEWERAFCGLDAQNAPLALKAIGVGEDPNTGLILIGGRNLLESIPMPAALALDVPAVPWVGSNNALRERYCVLDGRRDAFLATVCSRVEQARSDILEREMPRLKALAEQRRAERAAAEAAEAERLKAVYAERLQSGRYERAVEAYNEKRYGQPWIAAVGLVEGCAKLVYDFTVGGCTAKWGSTGILTIACKPGDVIAWGQRDLRRPDNSTHEILRMREDGGMEAMDRTEALRHLRARAKG